MTARMQHVARCMNCQKQWITGCCIPSFCSEKCEREWTEWWNGVQASANNSRVAAGLEPEGTDDSPPDRELDRIEQIDNLLREGERNE